MLAQTSTDSTDYRFPVCVLKDVSAKDVEASYFDDLKVAVFDSK